MRIRSCLLAILLPLALSLACTESEEPSRPGLTANNGKADSATDGADAATDDTDEAGTGDVPGTAFELEFELPSAELRAFAQAMDDACFDAGQICEVELDAWRYAAQEAPSISELGAAIIPTLDARISYTNLGAVEPDDVDIEDLGTFLDLTRGMASGDFELGLLVATSVPDEITDAEHTRVLVHYPEAQLAISLEVTHFFE